jgi:hypothetical protein
MPFTILEVKCGNDNLSVRVFSWSLLLLLGHSRSTDNTNACQTESEISSPSSVKEKFFTPETKQRESTKLWCGDEGVNLLTAKELESKFEADAAAAGGLVDKRDAVRDDGERSFTGVEKRFTELLPVIAEILASFAVRV